MTSALQMNLLEAPIFPAASSWAASGDSRLISERIRSLPDISSSTRTRLKADLVGSATTSIQERLELRLLSFKKMTSPIAMYLDRGWRAQLFETLDKLFDVDDWDSDFTLPLEQSFATFLRLVIHIHPTKRPGLGLSARGYVLASWSRDRDRIVIECLPHDELRWVLSQSNDGRRESAAGKNRIQRLVELIEGYEPDRFFKDGDKVVA
jgi:hypothetical protein